MEFNSDNDFEDNNDNFDTTDDTSSNEGESRNLSRERTEQKRREFTSIILDDEMKELIIRVSRTAQDPNHQDFLSKQTSYEIFHIQLKNYMITKYGKKRKPIQTDNLAFVLALSYPEFMIRHFNSFADLKLAFNNIEEESDFKPFGYESGEWEHTCICNEPLCSVYRFQNIHSGINFNIGSVCNKRYGLISKNDPNYKSNEIKLKEHKEKERERKEGLPEGFYERERQSKKQEKQEKKLKKLEEKLKKLEEKLNKLNKKEPGGFKIKKCLSCDKECIHKTCEIEICSICVPSKIKNKKPHLNNNIKKNFECISCDCELNIIYIKNNIQLCPICQQKWCLEKCKMCPEKFLKQKTVNDLYCLDCDEKLRQCIDCERDILKPSERCYKCEYKVKNNLVSIICKYCNKEEDVKKGEEKWKKNCTDCYKKLVVTKKCIVTDCNNTIKVMPDEKWKTKCRNCC
jgi:hypothetical protein